MFNNSIKEKVKDEIKRRKIVLCLDSLSSDTAVKTAKIAQECGINTFSVPLTAEYSGQTIKMLNEKLGDGAIVGADDVYCTEESDGDVEYACQYSAKFVSSPICNAKLTDKARELDCVCIGGGDTLTEIFSAHRNGGGFVRFSCTAGVSAEKIAEICADINYINLAVCGDVNSDTLEKWFESGLALYIWRSKNVSELAENEKWEELRELFKSEMNIINKM